MPLPFAGVTGAYWKLETIDMATKRTNSKAVAKRDDEVPAYLQALQAQGPAQNADNFDASDIAIPRIKLLQGTSDECTAFDNAKPGIFWHTGLDEPLGEDITFIICQRRKKYLLAAPLEDGQGVLARADDAVTWDRTGEWEIKLKGKKQKVKWAISDLNVEASGLASFGTSDPEDEDSPPAATLFYDYLVIIEGREDIGPAVLSLARSQIKKARRGLNDKIAMHEKAGRPIQALKFKATHVDDKNADGQAYFNFMFTGAGFATEDQFTQAKEMADLLNVMAVQGEAESVAEDPARRMTKDEAEEKAKGKF